MEWSDIVIANIEGIIKKKWQQECELVRMGYLRPEIALGHRYDMPCENEEDWEKIRAKYMPDANADPMSEVERLR